MKKVDCEEVKKGVHEYLHSELHEEELDLVTAHLANCDSCESHYDIEIILNQVIQRACDEVPADQLAKRVLDRLHEIQKND